MHILSGIYYAFSEIIAIMNINKVIVIGIKKEFVILIFMHTFICNYKCKTYLKVVLLLFHIYLFINVIYTFRGITSKDKSEILYD